MGLVPLVREELGHTCPHTHKDPARQPAETQGQQAGWPSVWGSGASVHTQPWRPQNPRAGTTQDTGMVGCQGRGRSLG